VPRLVELARSSPDPFPREAAILALGRIGDPDTLELLRRLAESPAVVRRRAANRALATFGA
jgi:HEAT repeat protein